MPEASLDTDDQRRRAFSRGLTEAVLGSGLTLVQIVQELQAVGARTSTATLSYWQNGHSMPTRSSSVQVVAELEKILRVPTGTLLSHLDRGEVAARRAFEVLPEVDTIKAVLKSYGLSMQRQNTALMSQDITTIHADRCTATETMRQVVRIDTDVVTAMPVVFQEPSGRQAPHLEAVMGCRIGRVYADDSHGLVVGELLLPRPMHRGELWWFEFRVRWAPAVEPQTMVDRRVVMPISLLTLDVVFECEPPVSACHESSALGDDGLGAVTHTSVPIHGNEVHITLKDAPAGVHGLSWDYRDVGAHDGRAASR